MMLLYMWLSLILVVTIASPLEAQPSVCQEASSKCTAAADFAQVSAYCSSRLHISDLTITQASHTVTKQVTCKLPPSSTASLSVFKRGIATARPPSPSCFGNSAQPSSCGCFDFATKTTTTNVATATVQGEFALGVQAGGCCDYKGLQAYIAGFGVHGEPYQVEFTYRNPDKAQLFLLDQNGHLMTNFTHHAAPNGNKLIQAYITHRQPRSEKPVYLDNDPTALNPANQLLTCHIEDSTCKLVCKSGAYDITKLCRGYFALLARESAGKPNACRPAHVFVDPYPNGPGN